MNLFESISFHFISFLFHEVSDLDKIYIQLCLDVDTFISAVTCHGSSGLVKLKEAVAGIRRAEPLAKSHLDL